MQKEEIEMNKKHIGLDIPWPNLSQAWAFARKWLLPNPGTLVLIVVLALAMPSLAAPHLAPEATSTSTISYQGRLADSAGNPLTGYYNLEFRIYDVPSGGVPLWEEFWTGGNSVQVSDGLFNVMLGSINTTLASAIAGHDELYLGITVGTDTEMVPRVQLGSVPFSMQAMTVPDGSITTEKVADGAVTQVKLGPDVSLVPPDGSITTEKLADSAVTSAKMDAVDAYSYVSTNESTSSTGWVSLPTPDLVTISLTRTQWVDIYYGATCGSTDGHPAYIGLSIDGGAVAGSTLIEMWHSTYWWISGFHRVQLAPGNHTIELRYKTNAGGTATYFRRKLLAFSVSQ
jgi:hypothetical protein